MFFLQCHAKYCELPVECKACGLTLVSAPHLARSYHHLFPLPAFDEVSLFLSVLRTRNVSNFLWCHFRSKVSNLKRCKSPIALLAHAILKVHVTLMCIDVQTARITSVVTVIFSFMKRFIPAPDVQVHPS